VRLSHTLGQEKVKSISIYFQDSSQACPNPYIRVFAGTPWTIDYPFDAVTKITVVPDEESQQQQNSTLTF
jgi:hypothetical protein